ncbi:hypothetical protein KGY79_13705 [Candidatus Bipolaricaulota bacterium]|nr:hypothetical protein [Candidatus Bipolaricaulota bacterium]
MRKKKINVTDKQTPPIWLSGAEDMDRAEHFAFVEFRADEELETIIVVDGEKELSFDRGEFQGVL